MKYYAILFIESVSYRTIYQTNFKCRFLCSKTIWFFFMLHFFFFIQFSTREHRGLVRINTKKCRDELQNKFLMNACSSVKKVERITKKTLWTQFCASLCSIIHLLVDAVPCILENLWNENPFSKVSNFFFLPEVESRGWAIQSIKLELASLSFVRCCSNALYAESALCDVGKTLIKWHFKGLNENFMQVFFDIFDENLKKKFPKISLKLL